MRPDYRGFIVASATNPKQIAEDDSVPQFKMATVTSVSPLRVRYDNELSASPATPRNLVGTLAVGDRVRVTLHRRKIAIDGRVGGVQYNPVLIPSGANLNTYITFGDFIQVANAGAAAGTNYPAPYAGHLRVVPEPDNPTGMVWQYYTPYSAQNSKTYWRSFYAGTWSVWCTSSDVFGAKLLKTSNQTYTATTWTQLLFDSVSYADRSSMADLANSRILIPETGRYMVGAAVNHPTTFGTAYQRTACIVRGTTMPASGSVDRLVMQNGFNTSDWYASLSTEDEFVSGQYVTLWFWSGVGSNLGANNNSSLWVRRTR